MLTPHSGPCSPQYKHSCEVLLTTPPLFFVKKTLPPQHFRSFFYAKKTGQSVFLLCPQHENRQHPFVASDRSISSVHSPWPRLVFLFIVVPLFLNIALYSVAFAFGPAFLTDTQKLLAMREDLARLNVLRILAFAGPTVFVLIRLLRGPLASVSTLPQHTAVAVTAAWIIASSLDMLIASLRIPLTQAYWIERVGEAMLFSAIAMVATLETGLLSLTAFRKSYPLPFYEHMTLHRALRLNYYAAALIMVGFAFAGLHIEWLTANPARVLLPGVLVFLIGFLVHHQNRRMGPVIRTLDSLRTEADRSDLERAQFLRKLSHDLRTPLGGILGGIDLLLQHPRTEEERKLLDVMRASSLALSASLDALVQWRVPEHQGDPVPGRRQLQGRVLVVDDHPVTLIVLERMLQHLGMEPIVTASLNQARKALLGTPFEIILLDLDLPDGDGRDLSQEIRKSNPHVPILAVTAAVVSEERASCLAAGMNDFLAKPVSLLGLESKLLEHVRNPHV